MLDSDFGLDCLLALYKCLGARVFEVDVVPILCPQFQDAALFQVLLTNLGVVLSDELITQVNESIEGHASVEENPVVGGHASMRGHTVMGGMLLWWNMLLLRKILLLGMMTVMRMLCYLIARTKGLTVMMILM